MRLLVSLRSEAEVAAALAGGADIVDAKEPSRGPLGPVAPDVLAAMSARVPPEMPFSVALGDFTSVAAVRSAIEATAVARVGPLYLKLGFAGEPSAAGVDRLISAAVPAAAARPGSPVIVPVAYADWRVARSPVPEEVLEAAVARGAGAFLLDTYSKDGEGLLDLLPLERVRALATKGREAGLLVALAGSLDLAAIARLGGTADVVGVRGAACVGGRTGKLDPARIRRLRGVLGPRSGGLGRTRGRARKQGSRRGPSRSAGS